MQDWKHLMDQIGQGVLICGEECRIEYFNESYGRFIGVRLEDVKGKRLREVRPGARAPEVLETGEPLQSLYRVENGEEYFADIYPIREEGRVTGTVSIVTYLRDVNLLVDKMQELEEEEEKLRIRMNLTNGTRYTFDDILGDSPVIRETVDLARRIAGFDVNVLLQGESGVGKELFAQAIHNESERRAEPFVAVNCAAFTKTMLESELFGYEEGAFTGARKGGKPGLLEAAEGGTVFLDEISEMDPDLQAKLLRVLQEKKMRRIGGIKEIDVDFRVISACNVDLMQRVRDKAFRSDLYYRIAVAPVNVPPLRERLEDVLLLAQEFLRGAEIQNKRHYTVAEEVKAVSQIYPWPGNIRELKNIVEYSAMLARDGVVTLDSLPPIMAAYLRGGGAPGEAAPSEKRAPRQGKIYAGALTDRVKEFEKDEIRKALTAYGDTTEGKRAAAKALGISLSSLYYKLGK